MRIATRRILNIMSDTSGSTSSHARTNRRSGCCGTKGCCGLTILVIATTVTIVWLRGCDPIGMLGGWILRLSPFQTTVSTTLTNALCELRPQGGLLVGWRTIDTTVQVDRERTIESFGYTIPVGSVHVMLAVPENRAQYILPADQPWTAVVLGDDAVLLIVPPPVVNDKVVEVQSDPSKIRVYIDNDWVEHLIPSGGDIDEAKRLIRRSVIESASSKPALAEVRIEARQKAQSFFEGLLAGVLGRPIKVVVQFNDESSPAGVAVELDDDPKS